MKSSVPPNLGELAWRTARQCNGGNCIQVAASGGNVMIGKTQLPNGPVLTYTQSEWAAFVEGVRLGDFDNLQG